MVRLTIGIDMKTVLRPALVLFVTLSLICGVLYPYLVTGIGQLAFSGEANGSLITQNGKLVGSSLIGQSFSSPIYFWGRPSATSPMPNNPTASSGSNLSPSNPALIDAIKGRLDALRAADPSNTSPVPVDLVTASASGLDPDISIAAAEFQSARVGRARHISKEEVQALIRKEAMPQYFGFFGEPRVNVLALNLLLDQSTH